MNLPEKYRIGRTEGAVSGMSLNPAYVKAIEEEREALEREIENLLVDIEEARDVLRALFINEGKPHTPDIVGEMNREVGKILDRWAQRVASKTVREKLHSKYLAAQEYLK